jgi:hypothetical protein
VSAILERADELFGDSADIVVYEAVPEGEERKGLARRARGWLSGRRPAEY